MVFAFNPNDDGWVIYGPNNSYNLRCPKDLSDHIVGAAEKDETVASVAISLDGSWFIKTTTHTHLSIEEHNSKAIKKLLAGRSPKLRLDQLEWFAFMPSPDGYFASFHLDDGRLCYRWDGLPESLDVYLDTVAPRSIVSLSVGKCGCWVTILSDGTIDWFGITPSLQERLRASHGDVKSVQLDLAVEGRWFLEYQNGSIAYSLPAEWHAIVNDIYQSSSSSLHSQPFHRPTAEMSPIIVALQSTTIDVPSTTAQVPLTTAEVLPTTVEVLPTTVEVLPTTSKVPLTTVEVLPTTSKVPSTTVKVTELPTTVKVLPETDKVPSTMVNVELPSDSLARLGDILGEDKISFLDDLEASICKHIIGTGRQCVAVVQKKPNLDGTDDDPASQYILLTYELKMDDLGDFVKVLFKFMRKKRHQGYELDSALTAPVLDIVQQKFSCLYEAHGQEISQVFLQALRTDDILLESFVSRLSDMMSTKASREAQRQIVELIAHQMHDALTSHAARVIGDGVAHCSTTAVGSQVPARVLLHALSTNIGHVISEFMTSTVFKKLVYSLVHKVIMAVIVGAVVNFLTVTFGGSVGAGALSFVLFPVMAGILYQQAKELPIKLGREVSKSVRDHLSLGFEGMNREILSGTFERIFEGRELLEAVAEDPDIKKMFHNLAQEFG